jgi:hypothetical protein
LKAAVRLPPNGHPKYFAKKRTPLQTLSKEGWMVF